MKKIFFLLFLLIGIVGFAQNSGITYQAVIYGPSGQQLPGSNNQQYILANKTICLRFSIIDQTGTVEYQETIVTTTDKFGMVNLLIGTGTQVSGYAPNFAGIIWNANTKSLKVELDPSQNCQNFTQISNNPFTYVPFAYYSANPGNPGPPGPAGPQGPQGVAGINGSNGAQGIQGLQGPIGLTGPQGPQGIQGLTGPAGTTGSQGPIGLTGVQGPQGVAGINGSNGAQGIQGLQGPIGQTGPSGLTGAQGPQGIPGTNGINGVDGATGPIGPIGLTGPSGVTGPQGIPGTNGINGVDGATGQQGPIGLTGPTGATGPQGTPGTNGINGVDGATGPIGPIGLTGPSGVTGPQGIPGTNGINGVDGATGQQGPIGLTGPTGATGPQGTPGTNGINGVDGATGPQGSIGLTGAQGVQGTPGTNGINGVDGATGPQGPIGLTGPAGATGPQGTPGTNGINGVDGATGPQGPIGLTGAAGTNGTNGIDGVDGAIGLTGPAGPQGPIGLTGAQGLQGIPGTNGINGVDGATGPQGIAGVTGPQGTIGVTGATGAQGPAGTNGTNGLSAYQVWLNAGNLGTEAQFLSSLQGVQGIQGTAGTTGLQGPQGIQGPAGAQGTQGTTGATGLQGPQGIQGPAGSQGLQGITGQTGPQGPAGLLSNGTNAGNTPYWNGTQWIVNNSNIHNNGAGVGIGTDNPNTSAKLDISSSTQGFLPPRMTTNQRDAITSPAIGLVIFNISTNCLNFFIGSGWNETCGNPILPSGTVTTINCGTATNTGTITQGTAASGVSSSVPYTGGNGGSHSGQTVTSTGVTGLTATLSSGTFANGNGTLVYNITGTPSASGTASFALSIGGQTCALNLSVAINLVTQYPAGSVFCASGPTAIVDVTNPTTGKIWMDRNLGATRAATSATDTAAYGDLYQWGRGSDGHQCRNSATTTTLSSSDQPGNGNFIVISNTPYDWRSTQNDNLWQGINGTNNPCPNGYRIPTENELSQEQLSWSNNDSFGAFNSPLKLSMTGYRNVATGVLTLVNQRGCIWSSTISGTSSRNLIFSTEIAWHADDIRASGESVRCIKDASAITGTVGSINCGSATNTGTLTQGTAASGVSSSIPYTGGNGGSHSGQTVTSTGVTGLTATLSSGIFANGNGTLVYSITGTPSASGTASFALNIGGQTCNLNISVASILVTQYPAGSVFCASGPTAIVDVVNPTTGRMWMDRNLGASQAATSSTDALSYGDLYQWGRGSDGHQCRNSNTISTLSSTDQPGHGNFIIVSFAPYDWRSPQNNNLWQGLNGINNPCPSGYRLPTNTELNTERLSWNNNNSVGAFTSPLKLPLAGLRYGGYYNEGTGAFYWTSTLSSTDSMYLSIKTFDSNMYNDSHGRAFSVRCIKY
jgi:uncharacterized protein (TIGR02145 family)